MDWEYESNQCRQYLLWGDAFQPVHHAGVGGKPGNPNNRQGLLRWWLTCWWSEERQPALVGHTDQHWGTPWDPLHWLQLLTSIQKAGSVSLDSTCGAGVLATLAADALAGNGVGHGGCPSKG